MKPKKLPETSIDAWKSITKEQLTDHHQKIISALTKLGEASPEQISAYCNLDYWQVSRRLSEIERNQLIFRTSNKIKTRRGRFAFTWKISNPPAPKTEPNKIIQAELFS